MSVQKQFEVLGPLNLVSGAVKPLVQSLINDDVHPTTIIAARDCGSRISVDQSLISRGKDALKSNHNAVVEGTLLCFGLVTCPTISTFRESVELVSLFVVIVALKFCRYKDPEIADIVFQFWLSPGSSQRSLTPTSKRELCKLIDALSGHTEILLCELQSIFSLVISTVVIESPLGWNASMDTRPGTNEMARLLLGVFDALPDQTVEYIQLSGMSGAVWIATVLSWLQPGHTSLSAQGQSLIGPSSGKIRIVIIPSTSSALQPQPWTMKTWCGLEPSSLILSSRHGEPTLGAPQTIGAFPMSGVRTLLSGSYNTAHEVRVVGAVSAGLMDIIMQEGQIYPPDFKDKEWKRTAFGAIPHRKLSMLCAPRFKAKAGNMIEEFGWELDEIAAVRDEFLQWERFRRHPQDPKPDTMDDFERRRSTIVPRKPVKGQRDLKDLYRDTSLGNFLEHIVIHDPRKFGPKAHKIEAMIDDVLRIASHGILLAFMEFERMSKDYRLHAPKSWIWQLLDPEGSSMNPTKDKITTTKLRELCFLTAGVLARASPGGRTPLASSARGRSAFLNVFLTHETSQNSLLQVSVIPGHIIFEGATFDSVTEERDHVTCGKPGGKNHEKVTLDCAYDENSIPFFPETPLDTEDGRVQHVISEDVKCLLMKTELYEYNGRELIGEVNYDDTLTSMVYATHISRSPDVPASITDVLRTEIRQGIHQLACFRDGYNQISAGRHLVTLNPRSSTQRFFAAHPSFNNEDYALYIQQGASLTDCLLEVAQNKDGFRPQGDTEVAWKIIAGQDY